MSIQPHETNFYHMDGALRAYSNRMVIIAGVLSVIALIATAGIVIAWVQPPTVIRVLPSGQAQVISASGSLKKAVNPVLLRNVEASEEPTAFEKENYCQTFLEKYLSYDSHNLTQNWSDALNMMTVNLRRAALEQFQKDDTVGKMQDEQARSQLKLTGVPTQDPGDPLTFHGYGIRTVHRMDSQQEMVDDLIESYTVRLAVTGRSTQNPSGLLIAAFQEQQISADTKKAEVAAPTIGGTE